MPPQRTAIEAFRGPYEWLSNFAPAGEIFWGKYGPFPTVEHAYQFAKLPKEVLAAKAALLVPKLQGCSAAKSKAWGKELAAKGLVRVDWKDKQEEVMYHLLLQKFNQPAFAEKLLRTGNAEIIEGNVYHDNFWGDCRCCTCPPAERGKFRPQDKCHMKGLNKLGVMLMQIRASLFERNPWRCPICGSPEGLGRKDQVAVLSRGLFADGQFVFNGDDVIDWEAVRPVSNPPEYYCFACDHTFEVVASPPEEA